MNYSKLIAIMHLMGYSHEAKKLKQAIKTGLKLNVHECLIDKKGKKINENSLLSEQLNTFVWDSISNRIILQKLHIKLLQMEKKNKNSNLSH